MFVSKVVSRPSHHTLKGMLLKPQIPYQHQHHYYSLLHNTTITTLIFVIFISTTTIFFSLNVPHIVSPDDCRGGYHHHYCGVGGIILYASSAPLPSVINTHTNSYTNFEVPLSGSQLDVVAMIDDAVADGEPAATFNAYGLRFDGTLTINGATGTTLPLRVLLLNAKSGFNTASFEFFIYVSGSLETTSTIEVIGGSFTSDRLDWRFMKTFFQITNSAVLRISNVTFVHKAALNAMTSMYILSSIGGTTRRYSTIELSNNIVIAEGGTSSAMSSPSTSVNIRMLFIFGSGMTLELPATILITNNTITVSNFIISGALVTSMAQFRLCIMSFKLGSMLIVNHNTIHVVNTTVGGSCAMYVVVADSPTIPLIFTTGSKLMVDNNTLSIFNTISDNGIYIFALSVTNLQVDKAGSSVSLTGSQISLIASSSTKTVNISLLYSRTVVKLNQGASLQILNQDVRCENSTAGTGLNVNGFVSNASNIGEEVLLEVFHNTFIFHTFNVLTSSSSSISFALLRMDTYDDTFSLSRMTLSVTSNTFDTRGVNIVSSSGGGDGIVASIVAFEPGTLLTYSNVTFTYNYIYVPPSSSSGPPPAPIANLMSGGFTMNTTTTCSNFINGVGCKVYGAETTVGSYSCIPAVFMFPTTIVSDCSTTLSRSLSIPQTSTINTPTSTKPLTITNSPPPTVSHPTTPSSTPSLSTNNTTPTSSYITTATPTIPSVSSTRTTTLAGEAPPLTGTVSPRTHTRGSNTPSHPTQTISPLISMNTPTPSSTAGSMSESSPRTQSQLPNCPTSSSSSSSSSKSCRYTTATTLSGPWNSGGGSSLAIALNSSTSTSSSPATHTISTNTTGCGSTSTGSITSGSVSVKVPFGLWSSGGYSLIAIQLLPTIADYFIDSSGGGGTGSISSSFPLLLPPITRISTDGMLEFTTMDVTPAHRGIDGVWIGVRVRYIGPTSRSAWRSSVDILLPQIWLTCLLEDSIVMLPISVDLVADDPIPKSITTVSNVAVAVGVIVPGALVRAGMVNNLIGMLRCSEFDAIEEVGFINNPFNWAVGREELQYYRGSVVTVIVFMFVMTVLIGVGIVGVRMYQQLTNAGHSTTAGGAVSSAGTDDGVGEDGGGGSLTTATTTASSSSSTWGRAVDTMRLPSTPLVIVLLASEMSVSPATSLILFHISNNNNDNNIDDSSSDVAASAGSVAGDVVLGIVVLVPLFTYMGMFVTRAICTEYVQVVENTTTAVTHDHLENDDNSKEITNTNISLLTRVARYALEPTHDVIIREQPITQQLQNDNEQPLLNGEAETTSSSSSLLSSKGERWLRRNFYFVADRRWAAYGAIEVIGGTLSNILEGVPLTTRSRWMCIGRPTGVLLISVILLLLLLVKVPNAMRLQQWCAVVVTVGMVLTSSLVLANAVSPSETLELTAGYVGAVVAGVIMILGVVEMVTVLMTYFPGIRAMLTLQSRTLQAIVERSRENRELQQQLLLRNKNSNSTTTTTTLIGLVGGAAATTPPLHLHDCVSNTSSSSSSSFDILLNNNRAAATATRSPPLQSHGRHRRHRPGMRGGGDADDDKYHCEGFVDTHGLCHNNNNNRSNANNSGTGSSSSDYSMDSLSDGGGPMNERVVTNRILTHIEEYEEELMRVGRSALL